MQKYNTVLFDADETLLDFKKAENEAIKAAFLEFNIPISEEIIKTYSEINSSLWKKLERKEIDKASLKTERFRELRERFGFPYDPSEMAKVYEKNLSEQAYVLDGAKEICEKLSKICRLYIVTNGIKAVQTNRFEKSGLKPYFADSFISEDVGFEKPDRRYFETVAARIPNFDIERTLIIGDSLSSDIAGGINFGIDTCWYNPKGLFGEGMTYTVNDLAQIEEVIMGEGENFAE
jgi:2-haloacid dehalogenase